MKEKITKVRLTIEYNTAMGQKISDVMSNMDLGIDEITPEPIVLEISTRSKVDKKYKDSLIKSMKKRFKKELIIKDVSLEIIKNI